jgi:phage gp46-like protein
MSDIALLWNAQTGAGDWGLSLAQSLIWTDETGNAILDQAGQPVAASFIAGTGLVEGDDLLTAVLISLFSDAEADVDDAILDSTNDPRGWWGGAIGSKLWLRTRAKALPVTLALVKHDIEQALAWLVSDAVAASVIVVTEWVRRGVLGAQVTIRRTNGITRALAFAQVWENL